MLVDCGEGAQRQMHRSTGLVQVDEIYITHFHADHYLGIPGLLKTYDLQDRRRPIRIIGPRGLHGLFKAISRIVGKVAYGVELVEIGEGDAIRRDGYEMRAFAVEHRMQALGYALVEDERPGRFDPKAAERLGVEPGPEFSRLQGGEEVRGSDGMVRPADVMGEARPGRKVVITGDTAPCEMTRVAAHEAELLVHDGAFAEAELARATETGHSTAGQAAELAAEAGVRLLALVHISTRYDARAVLEEARQRFEATISPRDFDLVEVPFPERGDPRLIEGGAKHRGPDQRAEPVPLAPGESGATDPR